MLKIIDSILWSIATILMVYSGIYFTYKLKFVQFNFKEMFKNIIKKEDNSISPFESLMMVLGGRIGVGSIAGIALAIYLGGIGSIFWMWIIGFISAANSFSETTLGVKYQEKDKNLYKGGPSYYIKNGLNNKKLGRFYALIIVISQVFGFLSIQANTITNSININPIISGLVITLVSFIIINKSTKQLFKISSKLVPIMTLIYIIASIFIIICNIDQIPNLLKSIISEAFNFKSLGFGVLSSFIVGIQRGIFSNEAGLGTGAIAASTVKTAFPVSQGYVQILGIYITTFLICTATALVILTSNINFLGNNLNGIEITQNAFIYHLGNVGNVIVIISIVLFAFSTILAGFYDAESNLKYLTNKTSYLKLIVCFVLFISSIIPAKTIWEIVNILTALLAITNIYALIKLKKDIIFELRRYKECGKMK
ncbi:MAG TPA: sodium:alanine symporter family protein [Candidatus Faecisoma merdavium]|nr:sodium:alanine symporter family protein [Candidatus Faecisoma merdavium]